MSWRRQLRLRLAHPVRHAHLAIHRRRVRQVFSGLVALAGTPVELAEAEVAVGDEGAHAAWPRKRQRLPVVNLSALGIESVGMGRDLAEQVQRMGGDTMVRPRMCHRTVAQTLRIIEPVEQ